MPETSTGAEPIQKDSSRSPHTPPSPAAVRVSRFSPHATPPIAGVANAPTKSVLTPAREAVEETWPIFVIAQGSSMEIPTPADGAVSDIPSD